MSSPLIAVALYLRMSSDKQETSIADQRTECRKYAKARGLRIVCEYVDEGISGDATERRAAFQKMIADSATGKFRGILCWDQDRFGRFDPLEAGYWIKPLRDNSVFLETVGQGRIDWEDFAGRIIYSVTQEGKHAYLRDLSRNSLRGMLSAAKNGKLLSQLSRGYVMRNGRMSIDKPLADLVREVFRLYLSGLGVRDVAANLNDRGIKPPRARVWSGNTIYRILTKEWYTGTYVWNVVGEAKYSEIKNGSVVPVRGPRKAFRRKDPGDVIRIENHHPAIIDRATFEKVQRRLVENRRHTFPRKGSDGYALSGLLFCAECGAPMYGRRRPYGIRERYYVCNTSVNESRCKPHKARESDLLPLISDGIVHYFSDKRRRKEFIDQVKRRLAERAKTTDVASLERRLAGVRGKIRKAKDRLLECDRDMLPFVQEQIRGLITEESELATRIAEIAGDEKQSGASVKEQMEQVIKIAKTLPRVIDLGPEKARRAISRMISRAKVFTEPIPPQPRSVRRKRKAGYRGRKPEYALKRVEIEFRIGAVLSLVASRR